MTEFAKRITALCKEAERFNNGKHWPHRTKEKVDVVLAATDYRVERGLQTICLEKVRGRCKLVYRCPGVPRISLIYTVAESQFSSMNVSDVYEVDPEKSSNGAS